MAIVTTKIGPISAYAIAKEEGYTGTKEQFAAEIGNASVNAQAAAASATEAEGYATSAATSASNAMSTTPEGYNSMMESIAPEYDPDNGVYAVGDYCRHNAEIYRCVTAVTVAEAFDTNKWTKVTVGGEISQLSEEKDSVLKNENIGFLADIPGELMRSDGTVRVNSLICRTDFVVIPDNAVSVTTNQMCFSSDLQTQYVINPSVVYYDGNKNVISGYGKGVVYGLMACPIPKNAKYAIINQPTYGDKYIHFDFTEKPYSIKKLFRSRDYYIGGLTLNGELSVASDRVRTVKCLKIPPKATVVLTNDAEYRLAEYSGPKATGETFLQFLDDGWRSVSTPIPEHAGKWVRILARLKNSPEITDANPFVDYANIEYVSEDNAEKPLSQMYLSVLGDSISSYVGYVPEGYQYYYDGVYHGVTDVSQMWWSVLCEKTGMIPMVINAYSGSGITQLEDSGHVNAIPISSTERTEGDALGTNRYPPDVIIIAGGLNDYTYARSAQSEPLPWDGTTDVADLTSFTQQYALMLKRLREAYPKAVVVCLSTFFSNRGTFNGTTYTHTVGSNKYTQKDYDDAIESVCKIMNVPFIPINEIGFNKNNYYPRFCIDSSTLATHPNAAGHRVIGEYVAGKIVDAIGPFLTV